jgi:hypothetical protein
LAFPPNLNTFSLETANALPEALLIMTGVRDWHDALGARWRNSLDNIGGRQPAYLAIPLHMVVVVAGGSKHRAVVASDTNKRVVGTFVTRVAVESPDITILLRLALLNVVSFICPAST